MRVFLVKEWQLRACMGDLVVPFLLDRCHAFVFVLQVGLNVRAQFEAVHAVEAIIRAGVAGRNDPSLCLILADEHFFLSPLRFPNSSFEVIIMAMPLEELSADSSLRQTSA